MFELMAAAFIAVGVIEEVIVPVGTQVVDNTMWAANQAYAHIDNWMN